MASLNTIQNARRENGATAGLRVAVAKRWTGRRGKRCKWDAQSMERFKVEGPPRDVDTNDTQGAGGALALPETHYSWLFIMHMRHPRRAAPRPLPIDNAALPISPRPREVSFEYPCSFAMARDEDSWVVGRNWVDGRSAHLRRGIGRWRWMRGGRRDLVVTRSWVTRVAREGGISSAGHREQSTGRDGSEARGLLDVCGDTPKHKHFRLVKLSGRKVCPLYGGMPNKGVVTVMNDWIASRGGHLIFWGGFSPITVKILYSNLRVLASSDFLFYLTTPFKSINRRNYIFSQAQLGWV
ncbi:hypothetical protein K438DRAFT_1755311 [Mycena galopus ATCC 62051]|nr:hypothetical protein K438DRAFT_1755311 [Mycena galopus ATCC 62051]